MRITEVRVMFSVHDVDDPEPATGEPAQPREDAVDDHWIRGKVAHPMSRYPEFRERREPGIAPGGSRAVIVQVTSSTGHVGTATTAGGRAAAAVVQDLLSYLVLGQSPFAHERIWDRMASATLRFGSAGLVMHGISVLDNAIWDLHGRITGEPVHALLGGRVHDAVRLYATGPRPEAGRALGFAAAKLPLTWAPCEGEDGLRANVDVARQARELVGAEYPLLYDCWMSLDVDYAVRLAHAVDEFGFGWIEEPLVPHDYTGHRRLRDRMPARMQLATGEHEYTAAGFRRLCEAGVDVVQPDPAWCGGMTELRRIAAVARSYGVRLVPHAGGMISYHFVATRPECELAEYPLLSIDGAAAAPQHAPLFTGEALPSDGSLTLPDTPGFGLDLAEDVRLVPALGDLPGALR